jgi:hypothetical protein
VKNSPVAHHRPPLRCGDDLAEGSDTILSPHGVVPRHLVPAASPTFSRCHASAMQGLAYGICLQCRTVPDDGPSSSTSLQYLTSPPDPTPTDRCFMVSPVSTGPADRLAPQDDADNSCMAGSLYGHLSSHPPPVPIRAVTSSNNQLGPARGRGTLVMFVGPTATPGKDGSGSLRWTTILIV